MKMQQVSQQMQISGNHGSFSGQQSKKLSINTKLKPLNIHGDSAGQMLESFGDICTISNCVQFL